MLYKKTRLEDTFGVNMLAIADGRPETMGLKQIIKSNVDFQFEVATRKYTNLLAKEMERKEIQEGLIKACNVIDLDHRNLTWFQRPSHGEGLPRRRQGGRDQV